MELLLNTIKNQLSIEKKTFIVHVKDLYVFRRVISKMALSNHNESQREKKNEKF